MAEENNNDALNNKDALLGEKDKGEQGDLQIEEEDGKKREVKDQRLESALGRITGMQGKVDGLESKFSGLDEKLDTILSTVSNPPQTQIAEPDYTQDADYMPSTKQELHQLYQGWRGEEIKKDQDYANGYMFQLDELAKGEEKETHQAIVDEMMANFNVRYSDHGPSDADRNYAKASRAYFKKQLGLKDKTSPITGPDEQHPPLGAGLGGEEMAEQQETGMPKLDPMAADFVRARGMSEEKVRAALKGEAPLSLRQNERI